METQLTDFENAAFCIFLVLLSRVIMTMPVDFGMPISLVDVNMQRAQRRDAIHSQRFHFRSSRHTSQTQEYTLADIFHGSPGDNTMPGLLPLVHSYLDSLNMSETERQRLNRYLDLVAMRVDGRLMSTATYFRQLVQQHPANRHESVVCESINCD